MAAKKTWYWAFFNDAAKVVSRLARANKNKPETKN
jgi:hypothetical protein